MVLARFRSINPGKTWCIGSAKLTSFTEAGPGAKTGFIDRDEHPSAALTSDLCSADLRARKAAPKVEL